MKACVHSVTKKYFAIVLVCVVGLLTLNNALFTHIHRLPCGQLVVHAHPLAGSAQNSSDSKTHQHSKIELLVFESLLLLYSNTTVYRVTVIDQNKDVVQLPYRATTRENTPQSLSNKAPPTLELLA